MAYRRSFQPSAQRVVAGEVPDFAEVEVGGVGLEDVLQPVPALGGKFELDGDGLFVIEPEEAVWDEAIGADALQAAFMAKAAFGRELAAGLLGELGGEVDQLEVVLKATEADGSKRRKIVTTAGDARLGQREDMAAVAYALAFEIAGIDQAL